MRRVSILVCLILVGCQSAEEKRLAMFAQQVEAKAAQKRGFTQADIDAFCKLTGFEEREVFASSGVYNQFRAFLRGEPVRTIPNDYSVPIIIAGFLAGSSRR